MDIALSILVVFFGIILAHICFVIFKYITVSLILNEAMTDYYNTKLMKATEEIDQKSNENIIEKKEDKTISNLIKEQNADELVNKEELKDDNEILKEFEKMAYENRGENIFAAVLQEDIDEIEVYYNTNRSWINAQDKRYNDITPLIVAVDKGSFQCVSLLIFLGVRINQPDNNKNTPLHWACFHGHRDIVSLLIRNGAVKYSENKDNQTPLDIAIKKKQLEVVKTFIECEDYKSIKKKYGIIPLELLKKLIILTLKGFWENK